MRFFFCNSRRKEEDMYIKGFGGNCGFNCGKTPTPSLTGQRGTEMAISIVTRTQQFTDAAMFEVEVGTTGECGGDGGNGGRTYLRFKDQGGSDFTPIVVAAGEVELRFGGDAELRNIIKALRFAADVLDGTLDDRTRWATRLWNEPHQPRG